MDQNDKESSGQDITTGQNLNKACESCRNSKLRCIVEHDSQDGSCKRCQATGRTCIFKSPRVRQRKRNHVDTRVATLERQLRALKVQLDQAQRWNVKNVAHKPCINTNPTTLPINAAPLRFEPPVTPASWPKKSNLAHNVLQASSRSSFEPEQSPALASNDGDGQPIGDVITRNLLTWEDAERLVGLYISDLASKYPFITLPTYSTAADLRRRRPATFLSIITAASSMSSPEDNALLTRELLTLVAQRIILEGEHTLDLAQAMVVLIIWYSTLDRFHSLRHYQFAHLAATIATDIDSVRPKQIDDTMQLCEEGVERLRTVLSIYMLCSGTSVTSGRPKMLQFTDNYISSSLALLEAQPNNDQWFIAWVKLQHLAEKAVSVFCTRDNLLDLTQASAQFKVIEYCQKLDTWRSSLEFELEGGLSIHYHYVRSLILCACLYTNYDLSNFHPPFRVQAIAASVEAFSFLNPFVAKTVTALIETIHSGLDAFLSFDVWGLQAAPLVYYIRTAHPLTVLLTLDLAVRQQGSKLSHIIDPDLLKVESYLHAFQTVLSSATENGSRSNPAKFLTIVERIESWWRLQTQMNSETVGRSRSLTVLISDHSKPIQGRADGGSHLRDFGKPSVSSSSRGIERIVPATSSIDVHENMPLEAVHGYGGNINDNDSLDNWVFDIGQDPENIFAPEIDWTAFEDPNTSL